MIDNSNPTFALEDLTGTRFGRLLVTSYAGRQARNTYWNCLCDCGRFRRVGAANLKRAYTMSCGCLRKERSEERLRVHGLQSSPEYSAWQRMIQCCTNSNHKDFHRFGGRGVTVCREWRHDFKRFLADKGHKPTKRHRLLLKSGEACEFSQDTCGWTLFEHKVAVPPWNQE